MPIVAVLLFALGTAGRYGMEVDPDQIAAGAMVAIGLGHVFSLIVLLAIVGEVASRPRATGTIMLGSYWVLLAVGCVTMGMLAG